MINSDKTHSKWMKYALNEAVKAYDNDEVPVGAIIIDDGAVEALRKGKSLLPAGVKEIHGHFERGDAVVIKSNNGEEFARGLIAYSSSDSQLIIGHKTDEIEAVLGYRGRGEMIHRDDLVIV